MPQGLILKPTYRVRANRPASPPAMYKAFAVGLISATCVLSQASIFDEIASALARGDRVELRGFGAFSVKQRESRIGRNPRTGEAVIVSAKRVPSFKTGKQLRIQLHSQLKLEPPCAPIVLRSLPGNACNIAQQAR